MPLAAFPTSTGSGDVLHKEDRVDLQGQGFDIIVDGDEVYIAGFYTQCNCRCARSTRIAGSDSLFEDVCLRRV